MIRQAGFFFLYDKFLFKHQRIRDYDQHFVSVTGVFTTLSGGEGVTCFFGDFEIIRFQVFVRVSLTIISFFMLNFIIISLCK